MPKTTPKEKTASVGHSSMPRTGEAKGRNDFVHLLTGSHSKGDGKGSDDGSAQGKPNIYWSKCQEKRTYYLVQASINGSCQREKLHVIAGMFPNASKYTAPGGCRFGDKCAKLADDKNNSASIAIHIPSDDERHVQILKNSVG